MRLVIEQVDAFQSEQVGQGELEGLFPLPDDDLLRLLSSEREVAVIFRGFCIFVYDIDDRFSRNFCIVQLHLAGGITLERLSMLFGLSLQHSYRLVAQFKAGGVDGLKENIQKRYGNRRLIDGQVGSFIKQERGRGRTFREISDLIRFRFKRNVKEKTLRVWMGANREEVVREDVQLELAVEDDINFESDIGCDEGLWQRNVYAGAMILHAMISWTGCLKPFTQYLVEGERVKGSAAGAERVILTLFFLHALRWKNIEQSKNIVGRDFAALVGGDFLRVQPLREAVDRVVENSGFDRAIETYYRNLIAMTDLGDRIYYTDGHFSTYYGKYNVPKGWDPRRQQAFRGRNTIYLHNSAGLNVYLFESPTNTTLATDIEKLVNDVTDLGMKLKRKTLFFDRGGYSSKCFRYLQIRKIYYGTYLKNRKKEREVPQASFVVHKFKTDSGDEIEYLIFEKEKRWMKFGQIRVIILLTSEGRQIPIITNNPYLRPSTIVFMLSRRWREENAFKYMIENFGIDLLCTYKTERAPDKIVKRPNLERQEINKEIQRKRSEIAKINEELGKKCLGITDGPKIEEFLGLQQQMDLKVKNVQVDIDNLERKRATLPTKISVNLSDEYVITQQKRRLFINAIKAMNYNTEKWLQILFNKHLGKTDETLSLIKNLWNRPGKIMTDETRIKVRLDPIDFKPMRESLPKVLEKLRENNHMRMPDGKILEISIMQHD